MRRLVRVGVAVVVLLGGLVAQPATAAAEHRTAGSAVTTTSTGWAVTKLWSQMPSADVSDVDAAGRTVVMAHRQCLGGCPDYFNYRISNDGGRTFPRSIFTGAPSYRPGQEPWVMAASTGWVLIATAGGNAASGYRLRLSRVDPAPDGPETTAEVAVDDLPSSIHAATSGEAAIVTFVSGDTPYVVRTQDRGATWSAPIAFVASYVRDVALNGSRGVLVATDLKGARQVHTSADGGVTWRQTSTLAPSADADVPRPRVALSDRGEIALATVEMQNGRRVGVVRTSSDGGRTWHAPVTLGTLAPGQLPDIESWGGSFAAVAGANGRLTRTAGSTWRRPAGLGFLTAEGAPAEFAGARGDVRVAYGSGGPMFAFGSTLVRGYVDRTRPQAQVVSGPPALRTRAGYYEDRFVFRATDPDDTGAVLRIQCAINTTVFQTCGKTYRRSTIPIDVGRYTMRVRAVDTAGHVSATDTYRWAIDNGAPRVWSRSGHEDVTLKRRYAFRYTGEDDGAGVASYDVRYVVAKQTSSRRPRVWRRPARLQGIRTTRAVVAVPKGSVVCSEARARDRLGRLGRWEKVGCALRPYDDRQLKRRGKVKRLRSRKDYSGTSTRLSSDGGFLVLRGVERNSLMDLIVRRTRGTPQVRITFGGWGSSQDVGGPPKHRVFLDMPTNIADRGGRMRIIAIREGPIIDGLVLYPPWIHRIWTRP